MRKTLGPIVFAFIILSFAGLNTATALDAPHDAVHGVFCEDCHILNRWSGGTPPQQKFLFNDVCERCHRPGGSAPFKLTHSNEVMNGIPGWRTECIDCHDPHFQKQLDNHGLENFYLVVGRLVSVTSDTPQAGLTSISYTSITIQNGWNLPPHSDNADWAAKTGSGRGLILVADSPNPQETFEVESATAQQIIIRGTLSSTYSGGTFGLIYGQLVRTTVNGSPVVFSSPAVFADNDGLAGGEDATPDGICQVCHIPTTPQNPTHWLSDGTLAQDHFNNVECAYCHNPAQGFRVVAPNHDLFIGGSVYCVDCHSDTEIVEVIHKENCGSCHGNADSLVLAGFEIVNNGGTINCETCHGTGYYSHSSFGP